MMKKNTEPEKVIRLRKKQQKFEEERFRQEYNAKVAEAEQRDLALKMS